MDERIAAWREALKDEKHPRHKAAWTLFSADMDPAFAARYLADQKEAVLGYLYEILDVPELYLETSFGEGNGPINAVKLLGEWQVLEAVPYLLEILRESEPGETVEEEAVEVLKKLGPPILDQLYEFAETADDDLSVSVVAILTEIAQGDPRAYEWTKSRFDAAQAEWDITFYAEMLLVIDPDKAIPLLQQQMRKYSKDLRRRLESYIKDVREGKLK